MDIFQWFLQKSGSVLTLHHQLNVNSELFITYLVLSLLIKRASFLAAFFFSCMLFEMQFFDALSEYNLYLLTFLCYSYVTVCCKTDKSLFACGIILLLSITFAIDSAMYGEQGYYGASETIVYNNIEYLAASAHCFFIGSLVPIQRIRNNIQSFIDSISHIALNSDYMLIYCYNVGKAINK